MLRRFLLKHLSEAAVNSWWPIIIFTVFIFIPVGIFASLNMPFLNWLIEHKWASGAFVWILFALVDARMHHQLIKEVIGTGIRFHVDPHVFANIYRFFVWLGLLGFVGWESAIAMGIVFPFFQCGQLYSLRNKDNVYQYLNGWWSNPSKDSSAKSNRFLKWWMRTLYAVIGLAWLFYLNRNNLW